MIRLAHIERVFQLGDSQVHALRDVNLEIGAGEYVSVMGPSGSGKSTLLNILGLLDRPSAGTYTLEDRDVSGLPADEQAQVRSQRIGFVFQSFHLVPRLTAAENIALPMMLAGLPTQERESRVRQALAEYDLESRAHHRPDQLSGGQRQRVAIARATIMRPAVILADEPTGNLDRTTGQEAIALLESLNAQGVTLVVVTHDPAMGERARRRLVMEDGAVVTDSVGKAPAAADTPPPPPPQAGEGRGGGEAEADTAPGPTPSDSPPPQPSPASGGGGIQQPRAGVVDQPSPTSGGGG